MRHVCTLDNGKSISVLRLLLYCEENLKTKRVKLNTIDGISKSNKASENLF
ncbi:hypothetical protein BH10BAC5_BH10BAC5_17140 [soil metagenome]